MEKEAETIEYITRTDLEEQTQIILATLDGRFGAVDKRFDIVDKRFSAMDKRLDEVRDDLRIDINNLQTLIDGYVKAQEDFKEEFVVMKEELKQIKSIIKEKLGLEIRAI
jgi:hypothetical protein